MMQTFKEYTEGLADSEVELVICQTFLGELFKVRKNFNMTISNFLIG